MTHKCDIGAPVATDVWPPSKKQAILEVLFAVVEGVLAYYTVNTAKYSEIQ